MKITKSQFYRHFRLIQRLTIISLLIVFAVLHAESSFAATHVFSFSINQSINITSYGAIPNDGQCDLAAMKAAIAAAKALGPNTEIVVPFGVYDFINFASNDKAAIEITNGSYLKIRANNSLFRIHDLTKNFIKTTYGSYFWFRGMTVEWKDLFFTQGTVAQVDTANNRIKVNVSSGYPAPSEVYLQGSLFHLQDPTIIGSHKPGTYTYYFTDSATSAGNGQYWVNISPVDAAKISEVLVGDRYTLRKRYDTHIADCFMTINPIFDFVDTRTCPGVLFKGNKTTAMVINNCECQLDGNNWCVGAADGVNLTSNRTGPHIDACIFLGLGDDIVNLHTFKQNILQKISNTKLLVSNNVFDIKIGDQLDVFRPQGGFFISGPIVTNVTQSGIDHEITLDRSIPGTLYTGTSDADDCIYNRALQSNNFVIKNSDFKYSRRIGLLIRAMNGDVYGNTFQGLASSAISGFTWGNMREGLRCLHVNIYSNTFIDCATSKRATDYNYPVIFLETSKYGGGQAIWKGHQYVDIYGNYFKNFESACVKLGNTWTCSFKDNTIDATASSFYGNPNYVVWLDNSVYSTVTGNDASGDNRTRTGNTLIQDSTNYTINTNTW